MQCVVTQSLRNDRSILYVPRFARLDPRNARLSSRTGREGAALLEIRLLGHLEVTLDGTAVDVDTRKALALLSYLAIEESTTREVVATLFWHESSAERARAALRRTLSSLKSGVGAGTIDADRNRITLLAADVDARRFDSELATTATHGHESGDVCSRCLPHLEKAADLYRGDFLEGFSIRDAPDFEDWVRNVAESYRSKAGEAFNRLAIARASAGDYPGAIAAANRWIDLDELHEPAHRLLMLLNAWAGDRPGAVEAYRGFIAVLDRELGVPPLEETTDLYEAILDEDLPPAPGVRRRVQTYAPPAPASDLIDRVEEIGRLRGLLDQSETRGVVAVITGGAWMGKTRLLEELTASAPRHLVLAGRSHKMEQGLPYGVISQIVTAATTAIAELGETVPGWALNEASRIVPALTRNDRPAEPDRFGELRLLEAIHQLLSTLSTERPTLIVVDDVQWIDPASAAVLSYLAHRIGPDRALLLMARRASEPVNDQIGTLLEEAETIFLDPLEADDLDGLTENPGDVIARTGGVPLLVSEMLSGKGDAGEVSRYLELRLAGISDLSRQVLTTASVLGGSCDVPLLRETSGRSDDEVVDAIEELVEVGLLREAPDTDAIAFTLDSLEAVVYDSLSLTRRRLLHRRAAEAMSRRPRARADARVAAATARQYQLAGDPEAADWYVTAGELARHVYANEEAAVFYETALALGTEDAGKVHLALGEIAMTGGDYRTAIRELNTAAARSEDAALGVVEHRLGEVHRLIGRFGIAAEQFERAAASHPDPAELYSDWSLLEHRLGHADRAFELIERALGSAKGRNALARVHTVYGVVATDPAEAMSHLDLALELAGDDELVLMAALNNKAHLLSDIGDYEAAISMVDRAIEIASRTGHRHREGALRNLAADIYHRSGQRELSERTQTEAMELFAEVGTDSLEPEVWLLSRW